MTRPEVWSLDRVRGLEGRETVMWVSPSVRERARKVLRFVEWSPGQPLDATWIVVVGGGTMIDEAKKLVHDELSGKRLVAIPSIWGSGAEGSKVVVLNRGAAKEIVMGDEYLPEARAVWPELADTVTPDRAREACGDVWAHAIEGFLSPLATPELRKEIAALVREMLDVPIAADGRWFELSARAAAAQARSSVGLVHGVAHVLEGPMTEGSGPAWGHARLCATYVAPVLAFHQRSGSKMSDLFQQYGIDGRRVRDVARRLFNGSQFQETLPFLEAAWDRVLRDRCTRTNATLVRRDDLGFFLGYEHE